MPAAPASKIELLAVAVAGGVTVRSWAASQGIPERTCYGWTRKPEFKSRVATLQAELIARALGLLSRSAAAAVARLSRIVRDNEAEPADQIRAAGLILAHLVAVRTAVQFSTELEEMKQQIATLAAKKGKRKP